MALDPTNPQQMALARDAAARINRAHGIPELEARARSWHLPMDVDRTGVETAYRLAEVAVSRAERNLRDLKASIKEREEEILADIGALASDPAHAARLKTVDARTAAAKQAARTDEVIAALKVALGEASHALEQAEDDLGRAKARTHDLTREHQMVVAEHYLAAARIAALAGIDAPAPTSTPGPTVASVPVARPPITPTPNAAA